RGKLVLSMDESVDKNYIEISEAIDEIDDLLDLEVVPYVDQIRGRRREILEESTGELETGIQECLLALAEYIMQKGAEESRQEFLEARANIQTWENVFIESAIKDQERKWARALNEKMDRVILKADELMINYDRRMEEYAKYSQMEIDADAYIENNLLALGDRLVANDLKDIDKDKSIIFIIILLLLVALIFILVFQNRYRIRKENQLKMLELSYRDSQLKAVMQSQEVERARYAQDLHDDYGQLIVVLKLNLQEIESRFNDLPESLIKMIQNSHNILQRMSEKLRSICLGLMPVTIKERGLVEALEELVFNINSTGALKINIKASNGFLELDLNKSILLYRICQEWLNNIMKHSNATHVIIHTFSNRNNLFISIEDDGQGFDKNKLFDSNGYGWRNIQSRARLLGAEVDIDSNEQHNSTKFILKIPNNDDNNLPQRFEFKKASSFSSAASF
ncbi:MAG: histidine kinase, partial [Bacteroidota bacterium]